MASRLRTRLRASTGLATPSLNIELATAAGGLDPRVTFSRGTQATLTDSTGKVTYAPNNLLTNSESFEASVWNKFGCTVTANSTAAPDGTTTADALVEDGTTGLHYIQQFFSTFTAGVTYTISAYVKPGIRSWMQLFLPSAAFSSSPDSYFDLSGAGALGSVVGSPVARGITAVGNGWYRVFVTATATATAGGNVPIVPASANGTTSYAGTNGATAVSLWGAQLEAVTYQTTPSTYNSTTPKNLLGYTQEFDNAAWTKSNAFVQTNLLTYSEQFDNAAWVKYASSVTANSTAAPDGTTTADTFTANGTSANHRIQQVFTAGSAKTMSVYVKAGTATFVQIMVDTDAAPWANFDLTNGTVGSTGSNQTASITAVGNGWYRCILYSSSATMAGLNISIVSSASASRAEINSSSGTVFLWGAQLVQGATAGDYQPTYAAAAAVQYAAPDGTLSADKLVEDTANASHRVSQGITTTVSPYTFSVYLKAAERSFALIYTGTVNTGVMVDLSTGATNTVAGITAPTATSVTAVGNGWYRCSISFTATAATNVMFVYAASNSTTYTYTGDGTSGIYVWGAQLSNSASLDPYVYNPGAAPTSAAYYGPRFDYDPVTLAPKGLLIEEQRSNFLLRSQELSNAAWGLTGATVSADVTTAPDGTTTADRLVETTATSAHFVSQASITSVSGASVTLSFYVKKGSLSTAPDFVQLYLAQAQFSATAYANYNIATGVLGTVGAGSTATITPAGSGWYRCTLTATASASSSTATGYLLFCNNSGTAALAPSYTGSTTSDVFVWGAQAEAGAFATSYIPTVASTVTRSADVAQMLGTNFSSWFNTNEGDFVVAADSAYGAGGLIGSTPTTGALLYSSIRDIKTFNGTNQLATGNLFTANTVFKAAMAYSLAGRAVVLNGGTVATDANLIQQPTAITLGGAFGGGYLNGHIQSIQYYPTRLTNTQLQVLST